MSAFLPVSYAIVGVQKAATSTLRQMLVRHEQVARGERKELHFFDDESRDWTNPDYTDYVVTRSSPSEKLAGDATPIYLFWPDALSRMRQYSADMRLIASFRDPIERTFSQWMMQVNRNGDRIQDFDQLVLEGLSVGDPSRPVKDGKHGRLRNRTVVSRAFYGRQLHDALEHFPRHQWLLLEFRDVVARQHETQARLAEFLGLDPFPANPAPRKRRSQPVPRRPAPTPAVLERLAKSLAGDLAEFETLSGLDVSGWATRRLLDGTLSAQQLADDLHVKARAD